MLLFSGKGAAPKSKKNEFCYGLPGNVNALGGSELNWDPAGFLEGKSELEVNRYREAELTHGRVGMLASLGFLVQEKYHPLFSGDGGPAIDQIPRLPVWLWVVMTAGIGAAEAYRINIAFRELDGEKLKAETGLRPGADRLRPARPRPGGPGRVPRNAGEGACPRAPRDDRGGGLPRAGGGLETDLGHRLGPPGLLSATFRQLSEWNSMDTSKFSTFREI